MKQSVKVNLIVLCAVLAFAGCTGRQADDGEAEGMWRSSKEGAAKQLARHNLDLGVEYDNHRNLMGIAELYYRKAYETLKDDPSQAWDIYAEAGYRYACMLYQHGDLGGVQAVADDMLKKAEAGKDFPVPFKAGLLSLMAKCQLRLAMPEAAKQTFAKAYDLQLTVLGGEQKGDFNLAITCGDIFLSFFKMGEYDEAGKWLKRYEEEFRTCERMGEGDSLIISEHNGLLALFKAQYLQATGRVGEAVAVYDALPRSQLVNPSCIKTAAAYLMAAGRYAEAADMYARLDSTFAAVDSSRTTFDIISQGLAPRYMAYRRAGRIPEALKMADKTFAAIDSAILWQRQEDAAELAVVYQTHEKDLAIEESEARAVIYRIILASAVIIILLIAYLLSRAYKYNKVLMKKNRKLYELISRTTSSTPNPSLAADSSLAETVTAPLPTRERLGEGLEKSGEALLFRRLCELMDAPDRIFTDAGLDRNRLAQLLGTNEHYVSNAISACTDGMTTTDFINGYRLRYAAHLLSTTTDSVALITELCGLSRRTFYRLFTETYGMSPSDYRQVAEK